MISINLKKAGWQVSIETLSLFMKPSIVRLQEKTRMKNNN